MQLIQWLSNTGIVLLGKFTEIAYGIIENNFF